MARVNEFGQQIGEVVEWTGATPGTPTVIEGRFVRLEPMTPDHAPAVFEALGSYPDVWTYQAEDAPTSSSQIAARIAASVAAGDQLPFAILDPWGTLVGRVSYLRIQPTIGSIEVGGIIYAPSLQRTRAATEVQQLLASHAFDELGYRRYEWKCDSLNAPSRAAALRLGFTEEGTWRQALVMKGRNRDTTWYSITDAEWPRVKAGLLRWLDDDNFDAQGQQRATLAQLRTSTR